MALRLDRIEFTNFRSYSSYVLPCEGDSCIIVGPNAVGKTNIIEGIQLMTGIDSFRSTRWEDLQKWGEPHTRINAHLIGDGRIIDESMILENGKRSYYLNDKKRRVSEMRGILPVVLFTPDDLRLIKDDSQKRRDAIDFIGIQLSSTYASLKNDYEKIVKQRNKLFKDECLNIGLLDSWTSSLVLIGSRFFQHRKNLFDKLCSMVVSIHHELIPGEKLDVKYVPSWARSEEDGSSPTPSSLEDLRTVFEREVDKRRGRELERRMTLIGPHRDEIQFFIDGRDARKYASQGQQRSIILSWKLAEVEVLREIGGQPPVLLLDDVMSELDATRREALTAYTRESIQTFITTTNLGYFNQDMVASSQIVELAKEI